jgi:excinuclease ABC subunit C
LPADPEAGAPDDTEPGAESEAKGAVPEGAALPAEGTAAAKASPESASGVAAEAAHDESAPAGNAAEAAHDESAPAGNAATDAPPADEKTSPSEREKLEQRMAEKAAAAPTGPGVYIFKDRRGKALYVGKAKNLRDRVRSYVRGGDGRYQVSFLMNRAADFETLVTVSETEALILENNLIKQYKPRYNIKLLDDKSYLSVKVTVKDQWPRILVTRKIVRDGSVYLGPFASASGIRETLEIARKIFPLRTCSDAVFRNRSRPCLEYQIKRCLAPCVLPVDRVEYERQLKGATQLLEGKTDALVADLRAAMAAAADEERFEDAARVRDRIEAVSKVAEKQKALVHGGGDRDVFGFYREGGFLEAQVLLVRAGKLVGNNSYRLEDFDFPDEEVISALTGRFYEGDRYIPEEVLLPLAFEGADALADYLTGLRGTKVSVFAPQRGDKRRLVEMALENARQAFADRSDEALRREKMLEELRTKLNLASTPKRIECFDISHVQGEAVVASMVVFDEGRPDKQSYRRYKLRGVQRNDDFAAMKEVLSRRLARGKDEGGLPDLLLVDGGRGQLSMAVEAMREIGVDGVELASLAKDKVRGEFQQEEIEHSEERVFRPGRSNPIVLRRNSNALFLLQQIRDEAHRFAIRFHRELRAKKRLRSVLDDIGGIGPGKKRALLSAFGSVKRIRAASVEEIAGVPGVGPVLAEKVAAALRSTAEPEA